MRVLLVRPPLFQVNFSLGIFPLGLYSQFMTRYPPLGMMYLASLLRRDGHEVAFIDAEGENLESESVIARMRPFAPELLVGNINVYNSYRNILDMITINNAFDVPLIVRGHFPSAYADETMSHPEIDYALTGKGFTSLAPLVRRIADGREPNDVGGVRFRRNAKVIDTGPEAPLADMDDLPFPARDLVDNRLYTTNLTYRRPFTTMFASLGCPFDCAYCQDRVVPFIARSASNVLDEIQECVQRYGIREITFLDPTFTIKRQWVLDICRGIVERGLDVSYTIRTRPDLLDEEMLALLAASGCVRISIGIETGDPELMAKIHRKITPEQIKPAIELIRRHGIMAFGYFMVGIPGESHRSLQNTLDFVRELPLDFAQFLLTVPTLHSEIWEYNSKLLNKDIWREIHYGRYPTPDEFRCRETELTLPEIDRWTNRLYRAFYLDSARWRSLLRMKFLPGYVRRQFEIAGTIVAQTILRFIRRRFPTFLLLRYPFARNGGPGSPRR
ncbi:MAG TPA: radical SAM protein [bacterium]|nr:radical SAM protein [bacterium]